jgi:hypothetical protein
VRDTNFGARCAMPAPDAGISSDAGGAAEAGTQPLQAATDAGSAADAAGEDTDAQTWPVDAALAADANSDATAAAIECNGLCVQINQSQTAAVCSRLCVFGEAGECAPASGGLRRGGCLFKTPGAAGVGDLGYCGELCDCTGDCSEPSFVCDAFDDPTLERVFARKGVCTDSSLVVGRPLPCKR